MQIQVYDAYRFTVVGLSVDKNNNNATAFIYFFYFFVIKFKVN